MSSNCNAISQSSWSCSSYCTSILNGLNYYCVPGKPTCVCPTCPTTTCPACPTTTTSTTETSTDSAEAALTCSSSSPNSVTLGLGVGLGFALVVAVITIVVLCVKLAKAKRELQCQNKQNVYTSVASSYPLGQSSAAESGSETNVATNISSMYTNLSVSNSTSNRETVYSPSTSYDYAYEENNVLGQPPNSNNIAKQENTANSVHYANVNKVKNHRNTSTRTLGNKRDDMTIVDNDLYKTDESDEVI